MNQLYFYIYVRFNIFTKHPIKKKKSESKIAINEVENLKIFHKYKSNAILYLHDLQVWVFSTTEL